MRFELGFKGADGLNFSDILRNIIPFSAHFTGNGLVRMPSHQLCSVISWPQIPVRDIVGYHIGKINRSHFVDNFIGNRTDLVTYTRLNRWYVGFHKKRTGTLRFPQIIYKPYYSIYTFLQRFHLFKVATYIYRKLQ